MGRPLDTPGRKRKDPATTGVGILNVVSGVLNAATATVKLVAVCVSFRRNLRKER